MRKTKIICTMGPSTDKEGILEQLAIEGMDVARFNFSHGPHEEQKGRLERLKAIRTKINRPIAALLDTKGPDIRIQEFEKGKVTVTEGQKFILTPGNRRKGICYLQRSLYGCEARRQYSYRRWSDRPEG